MSSGPVYRSILHPLGNCLGLWDTRVCRPRVSNVELRLCRREPCQELLGYSHSPFIPPLPRSSLCPGTPAGMQRQSGFPSWCSLSAPELLSMTCPHPGDKRMIHEVCRQYLIVSIVTYLFHPELGKVYSHFSSSHSLGEAGGPGVVRSMHMHGATLLGQSPGWLCGLRPWATSLPPLPE